jgi:uncharacterized protein (DUF58 family)
MEHGSAITDFLTPQEMSKLDTFVLRARSVVESSRSGMHKSPLKGSSVEFADYRQYVKGDNLRYIDWKVLGRTDRYYIKQFEEETSLRVQIILDSSGSMAFQSGKRPTKYDYACRVAAALAYVTTRQQDGLGLTIFDSEIRQHVPTRTGTRHLRTIAERLAENRPRGHTKTGYALHSLAEMIRRRALIVILSDLFDEPEEVFNAIAHFKKKMHDVIVMQILDPMELELDVDRVAEFIDLETDERLELDPRAAQLAYKGALQEFVNHTRERCQVLNVDYRLCSTKQTFEDFVHQYLIERRQMSL